jgi:hypothetical protein
MGRLKLRRVVVAEGDACAVGACVVGALKGMHELGPSNIRSDVFHDRVGR